MRSNSINIPKRDKLLIETANITFREASLLDLDIITQYTLEIHQYEDDGAVSPHVNFLQNLKNWLSTEINNPRSLFLIAETNNTPIGFIGSTSVINDNGFLANPIKGIIQLLWVVPEYRKKHIAEKMVDEVEHCFREIGVEYVECNYTVANKIAESFWEGLEYKKNSITARKFISS